MSKTLFKLRFKGNIRSETIPILVATIYNRETIYTEVDRGNKTKMTKVLLIVSFLLQYVLEVVDTIKGTENH